MLVGALVGGVLLRWVDPAAPLWLAAALLVGCAAGATLTARQPQSQAWR
jgi:predicted MFS family arabinose efflux permease